MGNINRMVDIVVLLILTGLSVSDIRNKKVSRRVLTLWGILTVIWKIVDFYRIRVFLEKMEQTNVDESCWNLCRNRSGSAVPSCQ